MNLRQSDSHTRDDGQLRDGAEALAIAALGFLAAEPERLRRFLAMTGIGPQSVREAAREPRFLAGVLDHLACHERLLLQLAAEKRIDPSEVIRARDLLAGGPPGRVMSHRMGWSAPR